MSTNLKRTLAEDLEALGVKGLDESSMAAIALGDGLSEGCGFQKGKKKKDEEDGEEPEKDGEDGEGDGEDGEDYEESVHDPLDGPFVTPQLFDSIMDLPFEKLTAEDVDRVIAGLKAKRVPRNIEGIAERAQVVAKRLMDEAVAKRVRRSKAHGMGKKVSFQCPPGMRKDPSDPSGKRCVRAAVAVGGAGNLSKITRKAARWAKSGSGKKSQRISQRWAERRGGPQTSEFAVELEALLSESQVGVASVRAEILGRIDNLAQLVVDEFDDVAVTTVFNEAIEPLRTSFEMGRLDEDVMSVDAFLAEIRPITQLISKAMDRVDRGN